MCIILYWPAFTYIILIAMYQVKWSIQSFSHYNWATYQFSTNHIAHWHIFKVSLQIAGKRIDSPIKIFQSPIHSQKICNSRVQIAFELGTGSLQRTRETSGDEYVVLRAYQRIVRLSMMHHWMALPEMEIPFSIVVLSASWGYRPCSLGELERVLL